VIGDIEFRRFERTKTFQVRSSDRTVKFENDKEYKSNSFNTRKAKTPFNDTPKEVHSNTQKNSEIMNPISQKSIF